MISLWFLLLLLLLLPFFCSINEKRCGKKNIQEKKGSLIYFAVQRSLYIYIFFLYGGKQTFSSAAPTT